MSWSTVARKEFADAIRSSLVPGLVVGFLAISFTVGSLPQIFGDPTIEEGISALAGTMLFLVPIVAVLIGYRSITGERESGNLQLLCALPLDRRDVLAGKLVGRGAIVFIPITIGFLLAIPFIYLVYGAFAFSEYVQFLLRAVVNGILYAVLAVAISASVSTSRRALAVVVGVFLFAYFAAYTLPDVIHWAIYGSVPDEPTTWMQFIETLPAHEALIVITDALFAMELSTDAPLLLQEWISVIVLLAWFVVPAAIGYRRFVASDLS